MVYSHKRESGIGYIGSRGGKHGGGLRRSHSGKKILKNGAFMGNGVQNFYKWGILGTF